MRVLLLLLALVQGTIVSLSTKEYITGPPYEVDWVDPSTGQLTKIVDLDIDNQRRPTSGGVLRNDNTVVYAIQSNTFDAYLTTVDLSTGKIQVGQTYPKTLFIDVQCDKVTSQTFAFAHNTSFGVFEVLPDQTLRQMIRLPGQVYGMGGTYSSSKHIYFLETGLSNTHVLAVSTAAEKGTILYNVSTGFDEVASLVYDDTFGVLYVWGYNGTHQSLVSLDYTTGKILKTFFTSAHAYGPACINKPATTMYTSLFDEGTNVGFVIHSVDLASGKASEVPTNRYAMTMNCL